MFNESLKENLLVVDFRQFDAECRGVVKMTGNFKITLYCLPYLLALVMIATSTPPGAFNATTNQSLNGCRWLHKPPNLT